MIHQRSHSIPLICNPISSTAIGNVWWQMVGSSPIGQPDPATLQGWKSDANFDHLIHFIPSLSSVAQTLRSTASRHQTSWNQLGCCQPNTCLHYLIAQSGLKMHQVQTGKTDKSSHYEFCSFYNFEKYKTNEEESDGWVDPSVNSFLQKIWKLKLDWYLGNTRCLGTL